MDETICNRCGLSKPFDNMAIRYHKNGRKTRRGHCIACQYAAQRRSATNSGHYPARVKSWRTDVYQRNMAHVLEYLTNHPCVDCGCANPILLEFDHVGDKNFAISYGVWQYAVDRIISEINKCVVRCANCHRKKTIRERGNFEWYYNKTQPPYASKTKAENMVRLMAVLESSGCVDCHEADATILEFDHVKGSKQFNIKSSINKPWMVIAEELNKCEVRCPNCHRTKTMSSQLTGPKITFIDA